MRFKLVAVVTAAVVATAVAIGGQTPQLKYAVTVKPAVLTLERHSGMAAPQYASVAITFSVTNPGKETFRGQTPDAKRFDIAVFPVHTDAGSQPPTDKPVWRWSDGQMFAQAVTPVTLAPGTKWSTTQTWKLIVQALADGQYRVVATYVPTGATAETGFELKTN